MIIVKKIKEDEMICPRCLGRGLKVRMEKSGCYGPSRTYRIPCPFCKGRRVVKKEKGLKHC